MHAVPVTKALAPIALFLSFRFVLFLVVLLLILLQVTMQDAPGFIDFSFPISLLAILSSPFIAVLIHSYFE